MRSRLRVRHSQRKIRTVSIKTVRLPVAQNAEQQHQNAGQAKETTLFLKGERDDPQQEKKGEGVGILEKAAQPVGSVEIGR